MKSVEYLDIGKRKMSGGKTASQAMGIIGAQRPECVWHKRRPCTSLVEWTGMLCGDAVDV